MDRPKVLALAMAALLLGAAVPAFAQTAGVPGTTRTTRPDGVTISFPGRASGLPHGAVPAPRPVDAAPPAANELGALGGAPPSAVGVAGIAPLQPGAVRPNAGLVPANPAPVQAFAASLPGSGVATAPWSAPPRHAVATPNWSSPVPQTAGCPWPYRRRLGC